VDGLVQNGIQVITYDYAGIGHSGGDVKLSMRGFASDLVGFLRALLPTLPNGITFVDVLGFSIGGYVAQQLVLDAPDLVRKMILAGTGPSGSHSTIGHQRPMAEVQSGIMADPPQAGPTVDAFFPSFITAPPAGETSIGMAWLNRILHARDGVAGQNGEPPFVFFTSGAPALPSLIRAYLSWDADPLPYALLQTIQKDVLVTAGDNDLIVPTANSFELARQIPRAKFFMYPGSGHGHLFQYPEFYTQQAAQFLKGGFPDAPAFAGAIAPLGDSFGVEH
jgi:pimeloyl-ACP methyl ester carboxylesterase